MKRFKDAKQTMVIVFEGQECDSNDILYENCELAQDIYDRKEFEEYMDIELDSFYDLQQDDFKEDSACKIINERYVVDAGFGITLETR